MNYEVSDILLIIAAIGTVLTNVIIAWRGKELSKRTKSIERHVNGEATRARSEITTLRAEREELRIIIDKLQTVALLAESKIRELQGKIGV